MSKKVYYGFAHPDDDSIMFYNSLKDAHDYILEYYDGEEDLDEYFVCEIKPIEKIKVGKIQFLPIKA